MDVMEDVLRLMPHNGRWAKDFLNYIQALKPDICKSDDMINDKLWTIEQLLRNDFLSSVTRHIDCELEDDIKFRREDSDPDQAMLKRLIAYREDDLKISATLVRLAAVFSAHERDDFGIS